MKREQYLKLLEERMNGYDSRFTEDIIESFRTHFIDGEAEGKTDEEIIASLGINNDDIDALIAQITASQQ